MIYKSRLLSGSKRPANATTVFLNVVQAVTGNFLYANSALPVSLTFNHISFCSSFHPFIVAIVSNWSIQSSHGFSPEKGSGVITGHSVFTSLLDIALLPNRSHSQELDDKRLSILPTTPIVESLPKTSSSINTRYNLF